MYQNPRSFSFAPYAAAAEAPKKRLAMAAGTSIRKQWDAAYGGAVVVDILRAAGAEGRQRSIWRLGSIVAIGKGG